LKKDAAGFPSGPLPFDFRALEVFLAVAETRSMTGAAMRFGLTQPAVSQMIGQLENALGVQLVDRKLRPLALTTAGVTLQQRAQPLIGEARQIVATVRESAAFKLPRIRIGAVDSFFTYFAPALGAELRNDAGQLSLWTGNTEHHAAALLNRDLDIAIIGDALEDVDGLERFELLEEYFILLLPESRRARDNSALAPLAAELPLIRYTSRQQIGAHIERYLRRLRLDIPRSQEFDHTQGIVSLVAAGLGWSITTPLCVLEALATTPGIFCAPLPDPGISRRLTLIARTGDLGRMPRRIAQLARRILRETCLPKVEEHMPWLGGKFRIAE